MRIKYVTNVRIPTPRAQGYAVLKMCSEFAKAGAEVELIVPNKFKGSQQEDPFKYYGVENNFSISRIPSTDFLSRTVKWGKILFWLDTFSFLLSVRKNIKFEKNDVIYTRDFLTIFSFRKHKNIFLELHSIPSSKFIFMRAINRAKIIFVLNINIKNDLIDLGVSESKIYISPSGVDIMEFDINLGKDEARNIVDLPKDKKIVVYTGHLYKWKGVDTLAEVAGLMPDALFVFIGGVVPEIDVFISKYKKYSNIIVRPFAERKVVPFYLKSADVLVIPNSNKERISSHYTSPLKLLEYMASKRPMVVSDLSSMKEVVTTNECIFAEPENSRDFADKINIVLNNLELAEKISQSAFEKVKQYSWQNKAKTILDIIDANK